MPSVAQLTARRLFCFGGQNGDFLPILESLVSGPSNITTAFLCAAHTAILKEASRLAPRDAVAPPSAIGSLRALIIYHRNTTLCNPAINGTLFTITQLALIFESGISFASAHSTYGFCSGALAAVAVAASTTAVDLLAISVEMVRLAFWVGVRSSQATRALQGELPPGKGTSCCLSVHGLSVDLLSQVLDTFNEKMMTPVQPPAYISGISSDLSLSVSGLPHQLELLAPLLSQKDRADYLSIPDNVRVRCHFLHVASLYHHPSLLARAAELVLQDVETYNIAPQLREPLRAPLCSAVTGEFITSSPNLIIHLVQTILTGVNNWPGVTSSLEALAKVDDALCKGSVRVVSIDTMGRGLGDSLVSALNRSRGDEAEKVVMEDPIAIVRSAPNTPGSTRLSQQKEIGVDPRIAIVSMSCRFPNGADTPEKFWDLLENQTNCCREIPEHLFDREKYRAENMKGRSSLDIPWGNFLDHPDLFDQHPFNISPREALQLDPQHRLVLHCAYEALEEAGYVPDQLATHDRKRVGCFIGASSDDYRENATADIGSYFVTGNIRAFIPGRVSFTFDWEGPSNSIDTACSSSLVAIEAACDALMAKQCDSALAGGVTVLTQPQMFIGYQKANMLSPTGQVKTFDDAVDGLTRGDGVGVVMLKRYADAIAEGDNIRGIIPGVRTNFAHPSWDNKDIVQTMTDLLFENCASANINPASNSIDYVEFHGLASKEREAQEMHAIVQAYASKRPIDKPLFIGSCKPTIGYSEAASGVASLIKGVLMLEKSAIPGTRGIQQLNTLFPDISRKNVVIPESTLKGIQLDTISINNFNFAGGNSNLLLQAGPKAPTRSASDPRQSFIVTISAKTAKSTAGIRDKYASEIEINENSTLADVSYTSTARRMHHGQRLAVIGSSWDEIRRELLKAQVVDAPEMKAPNVSLVLPGLAFTRGELADQLYKTSPTFRRAAEDVFELSDALGFETIDSEPIFKTSSVTGAFAYQYALGSLLFSWGITPCIVIGEGVGELVALALSEALSLEDAIYFACIRYGGQLHGSSQAECINKAASIVEGRAPRVPVFLTSARSLIRPETGGAWAQSHLSTLTTVTGAMPISEAVRGRVPERSGKVASHVLCLGEPEVAQSAHYHTHFFSAENSITQALQALYLSGASLNWTAYHRDHLSALRLVRLPRYVFDTSSFWMPYKDRDLLPREEKSEEEDTGEEAEDEESEEDFIPDTLADKFPLLQRCVRLPSEDDPSATYELDARTSPALLIIGGHEVHDVGIIPASMYCEMAMEAATHIHTLGPSGAVPTYEVRDVEIPQPFILDAAKPSQMLSLLIRPDGPGIFRCVWSSVQENGKKVDHASCTVVSLGVDEVTVKWKSLEKLISARKRGVLKTATLLDNGLAYKLFKKVVSYSKAYFGMQRVALLPESKEAVTVVRQSPEAPSGNFIINPCLIDSLGQITGFLPNVGLAGADEVCIANGCGSTLFSPDFFTAVSAEDRPTFEVYATGHELPGGIISTDCYIFSPQGVIVGMMGGVRFKRIKLAIMNRLLPRRAKEGEKNRAGNDHTAAPSAPKPIVMPATSSVPLRPKAVSTTSPSSLQADTIIGKMTKIIIEELGIQPQELTADKQVVDLGLDSLMALMILGRVRESEDVDLPSSLFLDYPTMGQVEKFIRDMLPGEGASGTDPLTPPDSISPSPVTPFPAFGNTDKADAIISALMSIAINELGVAQSELTVDKQLADLGLDSLMALMILGQICEKEDIDLPSSLFLDCPTMGDVEKFIRGMFPGIPQQESIGRPPLGSSDAENARPLPKTTMPPSRPLLLSRGRIPDQDPLFLFPDGSGTAAVYAEIGEIDRPVFGLNSPFLVCKEDYSWSVETLAGIYIESIRLRQPKGPYLLGGWSFGGIAAFEAARLLIAQGEQVLGLLLLDSPNPKWPPLPPTTLDWVFSDKSDVGMAAPPKFSDAMVRHFEATLAALASYKPLPLHNSPRVTMFSAVRGLGGNASDVRDFNFTVGWLQQSRAGLGTYGWEDYILPRENLACCEVDGNHFTLVRPPATVNLRQEILKRYPTS
ncbi:hypothetical protein BOTBODRAFT_509376 [Botryobasidium botryosum FD-172 SS1]|uniref:Polyketide synthase n=1 Tax=Botryobasidium botryosum (strain FD-172 SS1) TaxID=930990 RepID=A0A067N2H3_BOTB1|nr:hypothetical protein BOTBODRAFT_509376 [Botryobasidium botryosum FD-172 SS1]